MITVPIDIFEYETNMRRLSISYRALNSYVKNIDSFSIMPFVSGESIFIIGKKESVLFELKKHLPRPGRGSTALIYEPVDCTSASVLGLRLEILR